MAGGYGLVADANSRLKQNRELIKRISIKDRILNFPFPGKKKTVRYKRYSKQTRKELLKLLALERRREKRTNILLLAASGIITFAIMYGFLLLSRSNW